MATTTRATTMRAVIYARRSQQHQDASVETQVAEATRFVERKGWTLVRVYRDDDKNTGRREFKKRKQFLQLLADASGGEFDAVVVRDTSRLGGDTSRTMRAVEDLKDENVSVTTYIDEKEIRLDAWQDKALFAMTSAAAEGERDAIASRTFEALMVKARQGYVAGGSCYGYDLVPILEGSVKKRTEYRVNETQASVVREIFSWYAAGAGLRTIVRRLNERGEPSAHAGKARGTGSWSQSAVRSMLRRERYRGVVVYGETKKTYRKGTKTREHRPASQVVRVDVPHLRIIPEELWVAVESRRGDESRTSDTRKGGRPPKYMLTGLARCAMCGGPVHARKGKLGSAPAMMYGCSYHHDRGDAVCTNALRRPMADVDAKWIDAVKATVLTEEIVLAVLGVVRKRITEQCSGSAGEIAELESQATTLKKELGRLGQALIATDEKPGIVVEMISEREKRLTAIHSRLSLLKSAPDVLNLQVRRLEATVRKRLHALHDVLDRNPEKAHEVMAALLDGPLTFRPKETPEGRRYEVVGRIATGAVLHALSDPKLERPQGGVPVSGGWELRRFADDHRRLVTVRCAA